MSYVINNIPSDLQRAVLLIHSFKGCDTASSIFGHGHKALTKDRIPTSVTCDTFYDSGMLVIYRGTLRAQLRHSMGTFPVLVRALCPN